MSGCLATIFIAAIIAEFFLLPFASALGIDIGFFSTLFAWFAYQKLKPKLIFNCFDRPTIWGLGNYNNAMVAVFFRHTYVVSSQVDIILTGFLKLEAKLPSKFDLNWIL